MDILFLLAVDRYVLMKLHHAYLSESKTIHLLYPNFTFQHSERDFILRISAIEIYNEVVRDLLNSDGGNAPLRLLDDPEVYINSFFISFPLFVLRKLVLSIHL